MLNVMQCTIGDSWSGACMVLVQCLRQLCTPRLQAGTGRHQGMLDRRPRLMVVVLPVASKGLPAAGWLLTAWLLLTGATHMHGSNETARAAVLAAPVLPRVCSQHCSMCCFLSTCMQKHALNATALAPPLLLFLTIPQSR